MDGGTRDLPDIEIVEGDRDPIAQALPNNWVPKSNKIPLNRSLSLSYGDNFLIGGRDLGVLAAFSYKNNYEGQNLTYNSSEPLPRNRFAGTESSYEVLWAAIFNTSFKPSELHKFGIETTFNQAAEENIIQTGGEDYHWTPKLRQSIEWDERSLFVGKLTGDHNLPFAGGLDIEWKAFTSTSESRKPDVKFIDRQHQGIDRETGEIIWGLAENYRLWSVLDEHSTGLEADLEYPLGSSKLKAGVHSSSRDRDFDVDAFTTTYDTSSPSARKAAQLPLDEMFEAENYGQDKLRFKSYGPFSGKYDAKERVDAYYGMLNLPFGILGQSFRLVGGARWERAVIDIDGQTGQVTGDFSSSLDMTDLLPSANLTYAMNDRTNIRLAFSHSVNRPEFRELADVLYFDFHELQNVKGNPNLKRALVRNYDVRFEFFPRVGEVLAGSYFYKDFDDAIEVKLLNNPERAVRTWFNSSDGQNYGWELEARKSFDYSYAGAGMFFPMPWTALYYLLGSESGRLAVTANYSRIHSEMKFTDNRTGNEATRPLQGQSPWMMNITLTFEDVALRSTFSILYNSIGRRLTQVGDNPTLDIYEEPRDVLDLALTQAVTSDLKFKFTAKDVISEDQVYTWGEKNRSYRDITKSATYSVSLAYEL
jgi:outer membrane receptor protein involved in Fe transport